QLGVQERAADLAGYVGRPYIDPGVLIDLAAEEFLPVRPLVADDFGTLVEVRIVDALGAALAADVVLRLVEAEGAELAQRTKRAILVPGVHALGCVLDNAQAVLASDSENPVHLTGDAGIVDWKDGFRSRGNRFLNKAIINVQRIRPNID